MPEERLGHVAQQNRSRPSVAELLLSDDATSGSGVDATSAFDDDAMLTDVPTDSTDCIVL